MAKHPVERVIDVIAAFGLVRFVLTLLAIAVAYLVMGYTAVRIVGAIILVAVVLYGATVIRRFVKPS